MIRLYEQEINIPKYFFTDEDYKSMSNNAKLLYGLLAERLIDEMELEEVWHNPELRKYYGTRDANRDADGEIYINYPAEELAPLLNVSKSTVGKLFKELEAKNLITRKKRGQGKPDDIYLELAE